MALTLLLMVVKVQAFKKKERLLITGVNGFVGQNFVMRSCHLQNYDVIVSARGHKKVFSEMEYVHADLRDFEACVSLCNEVETVLHLAGVMMTSSAMQNGGNNFARDNTAVHLNMAKAASKVGVKKYIWMSSTTGYPVLPAPANEDSFLSGPVPARYLEVGELYRQLESIVLRQFSGLPTSVVTLRPTGVYGELDDFTTASGHVLPAFIGKYLNGETPKEIFADKLERRDWIYVGDVVQALDLVLQKVTTSQTMNIGSGHTISMYDLYTLLLDALGSRDGPKIVDGAFDPKSALDRCIDCSYSRKVLGDYQKVGIKEGLAKTISWFKSAGEE